MIKSLLSLFKESTRGFEGQEHGEEVAILLRRHLFTILLPLSTPFLLALVPPFAWFYFKEALIGYGELFIFGTSLWYMMLWLFGFYLLTLYSLNTFIITDRRVIENEQNGFFNRKVSELHVYRVQDVSVRTRGIIRTFIGYGDIIVQTAASEREFIFNDIPNPERIKDEIMRIVSTHRRNIGI